MTGGRKEHMIARIGASFLPLLLSSLIAVKLPRLPLQPSPPGITFFSVCGPSALASFDGSGLSARSPPAQPHLGGVVGPSLRGGGHNNCEEHRDVRNGVDGCDDRFGRHDRDRTSQ